MLLTQLARALDAAAFRGETDVNITGIAYDSRRVQRGDLFVCIRGYKLDGHRFAREAISRGAAALVVEEWLPDCPAPQIKVPSARAALADLSRAFYGDPSRELRLIGVTGTNGKTTVTYLVDAILTRAGRRSARLGTIDYKLGPEVIPADRTTPEASDLFRLLRRWADAGGEYVVMEVSSHALALERVRGCEFDVAVFLNLGHDHLDFHRTQEEYLAAKGRLFAGLGAPGSTKARKHAVLNADDPHAERMAALTRAPVIRFGRAPEADVRAEEVHTTARGVSFTLVAGAERLPVSLPLPGACNVTNALAALAVARAEEIPMPVAAEALATVHKVPGRYEVVRADGVTVIIDFAHNPEALANILAIAREAGPGPLTVVFGAEGRKDRSKRPLMGRVAARLADRCIITSDNTYDEDPEEIAREVEAGVREEGAPPLGCEVITDRFEAIHRALELAAPGAVVVVAGKGHESHWIVGDRRIPFNDRQVVESILARRSGRDGADPLCPTS